ncbi:MAG: hypothetical protein FWC69_05250, partial [Defluviitaleaceae bacterium]|nr:hypothetical protein [Defluviitaleaceae bacterium]
SFYLGNKTTIKKMYDLITEFLFKQYSIISGDERIGIKRKEEMFLKAYYLSKTFLENSKLTEENEIKDGILKEQEAFKRARDTIEAFDENEIIPYDELKKIRDEILRGPIMRRFPLELFDGSDGYNSFLDNESFIYIIMMFYCCNHDVISGRGLYLFPNMILRPKITFDRARHQQGFFIYQSYFAIEESILGFQEIPQNHIIEIKNTQEILAQLDAIGINYGTVYGDFDSIALNLKDKQREACCT